MTRKPFNPSPVAVVLQVASLLAVGAGLFAILIGDISRHRTDVARAEASSQAQLFAGPHKSDSKSR